MEGGWREDSKLSLPLVGDFIALLLITIVPLAGDQNQLRLNLASNCLQNRLSSKVVKYDPGSDKHNKEDGKKTLWTDMQGKYYVTLR